MKIEKQIFFSYFSNKIFKTLQKKNNKKTVHYENLFMQSIFNDLRSSIYKVSLNVS